MQKILHPSEGM